ncbi:MAG: UDPGP type 1 family protein [Planctomycetota bacterium]
MHARLAALEPMLRDAGQGHLLKFAGSLDESRAEAMADQIEAIEFGRLAVLLDRYVLSKPEFSLPEGVEPAGFFAHDPAQSELAYDHAAMHAVGEGLLRAGKVAAFVVAGGQGSRLGFDGPKGCYPAGAVTGKPLFRFFAEQLLAAERKHRRPVPWYVMTSPLNHGATVAFFEEHDHFGLAANQIRFFSQGTMPSFDMASGKILLADEGTIATNPDGHGGSITALEKSGSLADMRDRGIEHVSYFQVDNPIVRILDPVFLGLHAEGPGSSGEASSKMLPKAFAEEKMGMFTNDNGRTRVIEYSDLPMERQRETNDDGTLRFLAGSPAIHLFSVAFLERLNREARFALPFHRAEKKIPHLDVKTGERVEPSSPNGVKLEQFVFDALPMAEGSIVYESSRQREFAPIKNAQGADSPASSAQIQTERAAAMLQKLGVAVPRNTEGAADCVIELSPLTAQDPGDFDASELPAGIERGEKIAL